jgi:hypothetical protein
MISARRWSRGAGSGGLARLRGRRSVRRRSRAASAVPSGGWPRSGGPYRPVAPRAGQRGGQRRRRPAPPRSGPSRRSSSRHLPAAGRGARPDRPAPRYSPSGSRSRRPVPAWSPSVGPRRSTSWRARAPPRRRRPGLAWSGVARSRLRRAAQRSLGGRASRRGARQAVVCRAAAPHPTAPSRVHRSRPRGERCPCDNPRNRLARAATAAQPLGWRRASPWNFC